MEPQIRIGYSGPLLQQLSMGNIGSVELELQQDQTVRQLGPVQMKPQHPNQSMLLQQQQQQRRLLQMFGQSSQAAAADMNLLHQKPIAQLQQQQQQLLQEFGESSEAAAAHMNCLHQQPITELPQLQKKKLLKAIPWQHSQLQQQTPQRNLLLKSVLRPVYESGMCADRLAHYVYQQRNRPKDNSIDFWRKFVADFFAPNAKKRFCVSLYGNSQPKYGVLPQDLWQCGICNHKPGRGLETTAEVLPRLLKNMYDSGTLGELLYVDTPCEYLNESGQIVLDYSKVIQESVFEQLKVVHEGQLHVVFSPDLKICSWEFCAQRHTQFIPQSLKTSLINQPGVAAQGYQSALQNGSSNSSAQELESFCNGTTASDHQLSKAFQVSLVNDIGYLKGYVRLLQISDVVNSMKDLIDYSLQTGMGPMESITNFRQHNSSQQPEDPQQPQIIILGEHLGNVLDSVLGTTICAGNGAALASSSSSCVGELLHQNPRHENQMNKFFEQFDSI